MRASQSKFRWYKIWYDEKKERILEHPVKSFWKASGVAFLLYLLTMLYHTFGWHFLDASLYLAPQGEVTLHWMNILAIAGTLGTTLGFFYTYAQLKMANDRIYGYAKLYFWIDHLLDEIRNHRADKFHFYGSTLLPGNVSYTDGKEIEEYGTQLRRISEKKGDYINLEDVQIISPPLASYEVIYKWFESVVLSKTKEHFRDDDSGWIDFIKLKREDAERFLKNLLDAEVRHLRNGHIKEAGTPEVLELIKHHYFWSNGERIIYAIPLHYADSSKDNNSAVIPPHGATPPVPPSVQSRKPKVPHLIGFTTTSPEIVFAFEEHFAEIYDRT